MSCTTWSLRGLAAAVIVCGFGVTHAHADLVTNDPLNVSGLASDDVLGDTIWGTDAPLGSQDNGLDHLFGGTSTYADPDFSDLTIIVETGALAPQAGETFRGFILIDYFDFFPEDFDNHTFTVSGIKEAGENLITTVELTEVEFGGDTFAPTGMVTTDGTSITWSGLGPDLIDAGYFVRIEWAQTAAPAPGAVALLGIAGLTARRRRRRSAE